MSKPLLSIRLPEGRKEEWSEKAEELGFESRTALIETAVESYIAKGGFEEGGRLGDGEAVSSIQQSVDQLSSDMQDMKEEMRAIKRQSAATGQDVKELAHEVLPLLPPVDEDRDIREYEEYPKPLEEYEPAEVDVPVTVDALLAWLKADPEVDPGFVMTRGDVEEALEFLEDEFLARSQEIGGEIRWAKEV